MAPTKKSRTVTKRFSYVSDISPKKDGEKANKSGLRVSVVFVFLNWCDQLNLSKSIKGISGFLNVVSSDFILKFERPFYLASLGAVIFFFFFFSLKNEVV